MKNNTFLVAALATFLTALGVFGQTTQTIVVDPGSIGTTFNNKSISFSDLDGTLVSGQTITLNFVFPTGIDAEYQNNPAENPPNLYDWTIALGFTANNATIISAPTVYGVYPLNDSSEATFPGVASLASYNNTSSDYIANYNSEYSDTNLTNFLDQPYHGVTFTVVLPTLSESDVTISSASFNFEVNEDGDSTEIVAAPEPSTFGLLSCAGILALLLVNRTGPWQRLVSAAS